MIHDIDKFTRTLNEISADRNQKFINKSTDEISQIQQSVEFINSLFNGDFSFVKKAIFPGLWRFGLAHSITSSFSMSYQGSDGCNYRITPKNTRLFALYPQIKGKADYGFKEFFYNRDNYFNHIDATGNETISDYVNGTISKIVKDYFAYSMPFEFISTIVLEEILFNFYDNILCSLNDGACESDSLDVKCLYDGFCEVLSYVCHIITSKKLCQKEYSLKSLILGNARGGYNTEACIDIFRMIHILNCKEEFNRYRHTNHAADIEIYPNVLAFLQPMHLTYYVALQQLKERGIIQITRPWKCRYDEIVRSLMDGRVDGIEKLCEIWFSKLVEIYNDIYNRLFSTKKYYNSGRFEYAIKCIELIVSNFFSSYRKYQSDDLSISKSARSFDELNYWEKEDGLVYISNGATFESFIRGNMPLYHSVKCLLYQGICNGLGIKCEGLGLYHDKIFE